MTDCFVYVLYRISILNVSINMIGTIGGLAIAAAMKTNTSLKSNGNIYNKYILLWNIGLSHDILMNMVCK